jgi:hypothetical protein
MEFTNILFTVLIGFVFVTGMFIFYADMQTHYPNLAAADPGLSNLSAQMNQTSILLDSMTNQTLTQSVNTQNLNLGAIFGYVTGAINALTTLLLAPNLFLNMINAFGGALGFPLIPSFVLQAIGAAVYIVALIGILFYLLKVK